jgi:hypothetical protein
MNGPIAQLVALTCHANVFLKRGMVAPEFFQDNSTCKFCDLISFVEIKKSWFGKPGERIVAKNPQEWFKYLVATGASEVRIIHQARNDAGISDRMSAGFVGGGGQWMLRVRYPTATDYWIARWEVWNRHALEQRIWRVTYRRVARNESPPPADPNYSKAWTAFESALTRVHAFSLKHNCGGFTECFARAMRCLNEKSSGYGYHKDLSFQGSLSKSAEAMLDAAQTAWVFGGMGSWNDMGFDGEDQREYEAASEELFAAINNAICVAANESCI